MSLPCKIIYYITRKRVNKASNGDVIFSSRVTISSTHNGWVFVVSPDSLKFKHWNWIQITLSGGFLHKKPFFYKLPDNAWFTYFLSVFPRLSSKIKTSQWYSIWILDLQNYETWSLTASVLLKVYTPVCRITKLEVP